MEGLNTLEQEVLDKMLSGDHPALATLRRQASVGRMTKRELTGVGFYCSLDVPSEAPAVEGVVDFEITDVSADVRELAHGIGFVLFIRGGRLHMLEGATFDEPWPESVTGLVVRYPRSGRDLSNLKRDR